MTNKKYSSRSMPTITRNNGGKEVDWADDFYNIVDKAFDKSSVQSVRQISSIEDELSSILGVKKSKYSTVEEAVNDMKKRTGLSDFLKKKAEVEIFKSVPEMKTFIDNFVEGRPGIAIEAVVHELLKLNPIRNKLPNKNDIPDEVRGYINYKITEFKKNHPSRDLQNSNLGKVDYSTDDLNDQDSASDPLASLNPAVNK